MHTVFARRSAAALITLTWIGCLSIPRPIAPCPLTYSEQEKEVLAVVPKGLRREEVLKRLAAAGIEGNFGISRRVYYCDLWKRPNGERWQMNVALLFDDAGKLYKTQVAQCDIAPISSQRTPSDQGRSEGTLEGRTAAPAAADKSN